MVAVATGGAARRREPSGSARRAGVSRPKGKVPEGWESKGNERTAADEGECAEERE